MSLELSLLHQDRLIQAALLTVSDPRCRWYWGEWQIFSKVPENEWQYLHYVSATRSPDSLPILNGMLWAELDRSSRTIDQLGAVSFIPGSMVFARDMHAFFCKKLLLGGWERIGWSVTIGNPIEPMYDRLVESLGGRIVGTQRRFSRDRQTGQMLDRKLYEVLPSAVPAEMMQRLRLLYGGA